MSKETKGRKRSKGSNETIHLRVTKYAFYALIYAHFLFLLLQKMRQHRKIQQYLFDFSWIYVIQRNEKQPIEEVGFFMCREKGIHKK
jgi:hypothetical protein